MEAIQNDRTPSFYFMHYDLATWQVKNLLLIPSFAFPASAIIQRKPLSPAARRAGWVGCNIALNRIPLDARISIVTNESAIPPSVVREQFQRLKPLKALSVKQRGWTLDVLTLVRRIAGADQREFTNEEVYAFTRELEEWHPDNRHVRDKIRQQLQVLRDAGFLRHLGPGCWSLTV